MAPEDAALRACVNTIIGIVEQMIVLRLAPVFGKMAELEHRLAELERTFE